MIMILKINVYSSKCKNIDTIRLQNIEESCYIKNGGLTFTINSQSN